MTGTTWYIIPDCSTRKIQQVIVMIAFGLLHQTTINPCIRRPTSIIFLKFLMWLGSNRESFIFIKSLYWLSFVSVASIWKRLLSKLRLVMQRLRTYVYTYCIAALQLHEKFSQKSFYGEEILTKGVKTKMDKNGLAFAPKMKTNGLPLTK